MSEGKPSKPRRAWHCEVVVGGDTREDMVALLRDLLEAVETGSDDTVIGGMRSGGYVSVKHDPEMTHQKFFQSLMEWRLFDRAN